MVQAQTVMTFQAGRTLINTTGAPVYYNATYETSITTQYIDTWNNMNGITYFWGSTGPEYTYSLADYNAYNPQEKYRTLIRFSNLHRFIPSAAVLQSAELTVTFLNWNAPVLVEACFLTVPWAYVNGPSYRTTGWRYARHNGTASVPWSQPGAWADCSPDVLLSFVVPGNGAYGYVSQTLQLDASKVAGWLANGGAVNHGLLLRAVNGSLSFLTSQWRKDSPALRRPALALTYSSDPGATPPPAGPYPLALGAVPRVWWVDPAGDDEAGGGFADSPFRSPAKAVFEAWPGDSIYLRSGVYPGGFSITRPRITLRSAPGHWAVVALPRNDPQSAVNVITLRPGGDGGTIQAGFNVWAARGTLLAHNTVWQAQEAAQSCVTVAAYSHDYTPSGPVLTPSHGLALWGNLLVRSATARAGPVLQIRAAGLDPASPFVSGGNVYFDQKGLGVVPFQWGKGAMLEDERSGSAFVGNASGWAAHCVATLGQPLADLNSAEADPALGPDFAPLPCSPARGRVTPALPSGGDGTAGPVVVVDDFSGRPRPAGAGPRDAGAVQSDAAGPAKALPPVPAAFADRAPFAGVGPGPVYDKGWPYSYWQSRTCKDVFVDAVNGKDSQQFNYDSTYASPFKTIQAALTAINQCDRILLKGGQSHPGFFGIYRPNVTITTNPADLPANGRATVSCTAPRDTPCIRAGEGLYGGAAALNLTGFDVVMGGGASGTCIQLNEGAGSGVSAYWAFYLAATGRAPTVTTIADLTLSGCGLHGIKLSTFVRGVELLGLTIQSPRGAGIEVRGGGDLTVRGNTILSPGETGIRLGGGSRNVLVERNLIRNFGGRGILLGSDSTEVMYMDVDWALSQSQAGGAAGPDWHDSINTVVRNNILHGGAGAGVAFYSARDAVVVHNTLLGVAAGMQAGVLLNVSPKQTGPASEAGAPNTNITFRNNIVVLGGASNLLVEARTMQGSVVNKPPLELNPPAGTCPAAAAAGSGHHRRLLRGLADGTSGRSVDSANAASADVSAASAGSGRRQLQGQPLPFAAAFVAAPGEQGRNPDGSCPLFPADHAWHQDVSSLPVHPNSDAIKWRIGGGNLHPDFGGGITVTDVSSLPVHPNSDAIKWRIGGGNLHPDFGGGITVNGQRVLYGIPFITVDSSTTPLVQVDIGPSGYPDESDAPPAGVPFPPSAPVEGAYPGCPEPACGGDRHVLVVDNATCLLYETWRSFPPSVTGTGRWRADILACFNLSRNAQGRPLGWTSADAAGLAVLPGLVRWEEVVVRGVIDHAIRFTGPNSRRAYVPPATHFAPTGYTGPDAPAMGTRVRLRASFDCGPLAPAARVFCTALKKYGGIFADNGSPWYFSGEATPKWDAVLSQLYDIAKIPASAMEVLDSGCACLDAGCTAAECGGVISADPNALSVYPAINDTADLSFANNIYFAPGSASGGAVAVPTGRYVDRRVAPLGAGYDGGLEGWKSYVGGEAGSLEADPRVDPATYKPAAGSPAVGGVPRLAEAGEDFNGAPRGGAAMTDAGAVLAA
ncbi:hypothetical protein GPECTOR_81g201 [Gonium pectorale]|uniref:Right handed beta helix domain-containing protein n=1 Tax=Gonium pectorale TaxID=33097 RepID=A0A150G1R1_GONPE|nr:hypothetical protein GPECTOR_81g201 [Gonium pectorale]|eukprot:KXZ43751.1 hypothetical protein GPECTOR_81g201 [Gonium pectorale]